MSRNTFILKIYRGLPGRQYWEEFELERKPSLNVISVLLEIQKNPINRAGEKVTPVVWEAGCLEEVCGSCSVLVNGFPRQACTTLIEPVIEQTKKTTIVLAPFSKFPLVRDLVVNRDSMFENLKKVQAWIEVDHTFDQGPGPKVSPAKQEVMYSLATCMSCGCCVEACPQINRHSKFMGPQIMAQVRLFNAHPTGRMQQHKRLHPLMEEGGINGCGNAQNCVEVCPKNIPLTDAIAAIGRDVTKQAFRNLFSFFDRYL